MQKSIDQLKGMSAGEADDVIVMEQKAAHPDQSRRYFAVGFRDSSVRIVFPAVDDPLRYSAADRREGRAQDVIVGDRG
jgi:hypothetical protein